MRDNEPQWPVHSASVPRNRTARTAVLGLSVRRSAAGQLPSRTNSALRRRLVVGVLVAARARRSSRSRSGSPTTGRRPPSKAPRRPPCGRSRSRASVSRSRSGTCTPGSTGCSPRAPTPRSSARRTRRLRQAHIQNQFAANENATLKGLLGFRDGPRFPADYDGLAAAVIARPSGGFAQEIVVAVGSNDGVAARCPRRLRGRLPRPRDARLLALGPRHPAHRRTARRLGASTSKAAPPASSGTGGRRPPRSSSTGSRRS